MGRRHKTYFPDDSTLSGMVILNHNQTNDIDDMNTSMTSVRKVYRYLKGSTRGFTKFINEVKEESPDCCIDRGNAIRWHFDKNVIISKLQEDMDFKNILDKQGLDDYDRLYYWANKEYYS